MSKNLANICKMRICNPERANILLSCLITFLLLVTCKEEKEKKLNSGTIKDQSTAMVSGYAPVNSLKMYYEIHGEGQPLVLIHGGGSTIGTSFGRIIPELAKHRQVIAVELQAHGHTSDRETPESFEQDADDVAALVKFLHIQKADFFGFSNGGNTTMQIAIRHPELVRRIILGSSFYKREGMVPQFWEGMKKASLESMPMELQKEYKKVAQDSNGLITMFTKDKNRMMDFKDWKDQDLQSIKAPALIIASDRDVVKPEHTVQMHHLIVQSQLIILPGLHGEYIGEITTLPAGALQARLVIPLIEKFLDQQ
jgi:pimeloyl-ACP methyl ester carboxylesterase